MLFLTFFACKKNNSGTVTPPPVDTLDPELDTTHPTVTKTTLPYKGGFVDTLIYIEDDKLSYLYAYNGTKVEGTAVYTIALSYEYPGWINRIRSYTLGSLSTDASIKYLTNDSLTYGVIGGTFAGQRPEAYVLNKNGTPIKSYRFADLFGPFRLQRIWTIDSISKDIISEQATDTIFPWETSSTFTYTKILNPFYYIGRKNPIYGLKLSGITSLSKHMISTYSITDSILVESYTYETDSSGKWPIKQVLHNHLSGDSTVIIYTYKEISHQ